MMDKGTGRKCEGVRREREREKGEQSDEKKRKKKLGEVDNKGIKEENGKEEDQKKAFSCCVMRKAQQFLHLNTQHRPFHRPDH